MSQKEKMKADLVRIIDGHYMQLAYLKDLIKVQEDIDHYKEKIKNASIFFLIVECGLIDSYMIIFAKLFDKSEKAMTIPALLNKCKKNLNLFIDPDIVMNKIAEYELNMKSDEYISYAIEIVRKRRDTIIVHNDSKYFGEKIVDDTSHLAKYHLWMLRDFVNDILEFISKQLEINPHRYGTKYDGDLKNLFMPLGVQNNLSETVD